MRSRAWRSGRTLASSLGVDPRRLLLESYRAAVAAARPGDTVLLAGKGPEDTLERLHETIPWNEMQEGLDALEG